MAQKALFGGDSMVDEKIERERIQERDRMERMMNMRYGEIRKCDKGVPHAYDCSAAIHVATSNNPNTRGMKYFSCPYEISDGPGQGCGFRRWWNEALLDEFGKIKEEKNEMQKVLDEANKRIDSQEGRIFQLEMQLEQMVEDRKQLDEYEGEFFDNGLGVAQMMEKFEALEKSYEALEKKYVLEKKNNPGRL